MCITFQVETSVLVRIIEYLAINRQQQEVSVAARIDDLEARVTSMSMDIARMTMKTMAYESGFSDFLKCRTVDEVQDRVHKLQFIASEQSLKCTVIMLASIYRWKCSVKLV